MGKITVVTPQQKLILNEFKKNEFLRSHFYFTGGTALSLYYLKHRESIDLDFFSEQQFDVNNISEIITRWSQKNKFSITLEQIENLNVFFLGFSDKSQLKVDFAYYPYTRVERSKIDEGMEIDSLLDIAVNKLNTVIQRSEVKDFVDLYFLLKTYTVWDLMEGVRIKFGYEIEPFLIARDFMKVQEFDFLPKMLVPLQLQELQEFFKEKAKELAKKVVE